MQVSCENRAIAGGRLEFRADGVNGKLIGQCAVGYSGGIKDYVDLTGPVGGVSGVHDIFLVAHGRGGDARGHLFNVNWFTFTKSYAPQGEPFRAVNCGGDAVEGLSADQAYTAGGWGYEGDTAARSWMNPVYPTMSLPRAMKSERYAKAAGGSFDYKFTVPAGTYRVQLYFAEHSLNAYGARKFDVSINGVSKLHDFDAFLAAAGHDRGVMKEFSGIRASSGLLEIRFTSRVERAKVNAIKVYREATRSPRGSSASFTLPLAAFTRSPSDAGNRTTPKQTKGALSRPQ